MSTPRWWRPGITLWIVAWNNDRNESTAARLAHWKSHASVEARDLREEPRGGAMQLTYRLTEDGVETLIVLAFADVGHLQLSFSFDYEGDLAEVQQILASITAL